MWRAKAVCSHTGVSLGNEERTAGTHVQISNIMRSQRIKTCVHTLYVSTYVGREETILICGDRRTSVFQGLWAPLLEIMLWDGKQASLQVPALVLTSLNDRL